MIQGSSSGEMSQSSLIQNRVAEGGESSRSSEVALVNNNANNAPKRNCLTRMFWYIIGCFTEGFQKVRSLFDWKTKNVAQQDGQEAAGSGNGEEIAEPGQNGDSSAPEAIVVTERVQPRSPSADRLDQGLQNSQESNHSAENGSVGDVTPHWEVFVPTHRANKGRGPRKQATAQPARGEIKAFEEKHQKTLRAMQQQRQQLIDQHRNSDQTVYFRLVSQRKK